MSKENIQILEQINNYYKANQGGDISKELKQAYEFAEMAYFGEVRKSGRSVFNHSLNTALICSEVGGDEDTIISAILHDVFLCGVTESEVQEIFGAKVSNLLMSYLDIRNLREKYKHIDATDQVYNEYIRRLIITFATDLRVVIIRLAEKIDNLTDVESLSKEQQTVIFENCYRIYSPLAELIGFYSLKKRLDEEAFKKQNPKYYKACHTVLSNHKVANQDKFDKFYKKLLTDLSLAKVVYSKVYGRVKSTHSFYRKVLRYKKKYDISFDQAVINVKDKVAYAIICSNIENCYKALDVVHSKYRWLSEEFDDYIKKPKPNGYRSIHTIIEVTENTFVEVQIKTAEMHEFNEFGPASHTYYKIYGDAKAVDQQKIDTIKNLVGWKDNLLQGKGFSTSEIHSTILAITPKGDVYELEKGSTPIDFAYKVHTRIGDRAVRAMVNNKQVSLDYQLKDGDVVKIITQKNADPKYKWLDFVKTKEARICIKKKLKKMGKI